MKNVGKNNYLKIKTNSEKQNVKKVEGKTYRRKIKGQRESKKVEKER